MQVPMPPRTHFWWDKMGNNLHTKGHDGEDETETETMILPKKIYSQILTSLMNRHIFAITSGFDVVEKLFLANAETMISS